MLYSLLVLLGGSYVFISFFAAPLIAGVQPMLPGIEIPPELSEDRVSGTQTGPSWDDSRN